MGPPADQGRDPTRLWRLFGFLLGIYRDRWFGDVHIRFEDGLPHGKIEANKWQLVDQLPTPTEAQLQELVRKVAGES